MQSLILHNRLNTRFQAKIDQLLILSYANIVLFAASQIAIPLQPVPMTLQTFAAILIGASLGWQRAGIVMIAYLLEGAIGLPVFANFGAGLGVLLGPNAGYLFGFVPAAMLAGYLMQRGFAKHFLLSLLASFFSFAVIYFFGISALSVFVGWQRVFQFGFLPFFTLDLIQLIILASIIPRFWRAKLNG